MLEARDGRAVDADGRLVAVGGTFHKDCTWLPAEDVARAIRPARGPAADRRPGPALAAWTVMDSAR